LKVALSTIKQTNKQLYLVKNQNPVMRLTGGNG